MENKDKHIVISVGGSLIVPERVDTMFVTSFRDLIVSLIAEGYTFTLFTGGGGVCREYISSAEKLALTPLPTPQKDWIGIAATKLNAMFLKTVFGDYAHDEIITDPHTVFETAKPIVVGSGWKPGWSTDYDAVVHAGVVGAKQVINVSNIDFVYTKDPRKFSDAEKIEKITWEAYRKLIPDTWDAGLHSPFDPIASSKAEELGIKVAILNGVNITELRHAIIGAPFIGTEITPE